MKSFRFVLLFPIILFSCSKKENTPVNKPPVVNAGLSLEITLPVNTVTLNGSAVDPDGTITAYIWSLVSGPNVPVIQTPASPSTNVSGLVEGTYILQLLATDNAGASGVDTMSIKVNPNPEKTITLQPANNPNERMLVSIGGVDQSFTGTTEWVIDAWSVNYKPYYGRVAVKFDLSAIPSNATIVSANLYLYSNTPPENGNLVDANYGSNNALLIQRIVSAWTPSTTTWNNQPSTSVTDQVTVPHTNSSSLDLNVDVKGLVAGMVTNGNNGFLIKLQNEVAFTSRQFVASFHATKTDKRPKLVVVYK
jgi:hypothetical protein